MIGLTIDRQRQWRRMPRGVLKTLGQYLCLREKWQRGHGVGCARRPPALLLGITAETHFRLNAVIVRRQIGIAQRPVESDSMVLQQGKISLMHTQPHTVVVNR